MRVINFYYLLIPALLHFISSVSLAQDYIPMNFAQGVWIEDENHKDDFSSNQLYCDGDTIIDGLTYQKLCEFRIKFSAPGYIPDTVKSRLKGIIREDDSKKVFYKGISDNSCSVIYDFNLELGDTIQLVEDIFIINSIDSIEICGRYHKRYIQDISRSEYPETLTEGIGYSNGLLGYFEYFDFHESYNLLSCYSEWNNEQCSDCNPLTGLSDFFSTCSIYPNPSCGDISVHSTKRFNEVKIYNLSGVELFSEGTANSNSMVLQLDNYESGLYIVRVIYFDNTSVSTIIVKN